MSNAVPLAPVTTAGSVSASTFLKKVADWDGMSQDINRALTTAFEANDYLNCIENLPAKNIDPLSYVNSLDKVSSYSIPGKHAQLIQ